MKTDSIGVCGMLAFALSLSVGCANTKQVGQSSFEVIEPTPAPQAKTNLKVEANKDLVVDDIAARPLAELAKPIYPPAALAAHAGAFVVYVTITVDTTGHVSEVIPSWDRLNLPVKFSDAFLDSVKAAVQSWSFEPARLVYWQKGTNGNNKYLYAETVPTKSEIKFTFSASGKVQ